MTRRSFFIIALLALLVRGNAQQPAPAGAQLSSTANQLTPIIVADGKHRGNVDLSVDIDAAGNVAQTAPLSGDPKLIQLAEKAVRTFRYSNEAGVAGAHEHVAFLTGKDMHSVAPLYPPIARAAHVQGAVQLAAAVGPDGHVGNVIVLSGPPMLVGSAKMSLQQWTFPPPQVAGVPAAAHAIVIINYALW